MSYVPPRLPDIQPPLPPLGKWPREKSFWRRYSPHHEFTLSFITSLMVHICAGLTLVLFGSFLLGLGGHTTPTVDNLIIAGGGGTPGGTGKDTAAIDPSLTEAIRFEPQKPKETPRPVPVGDPRDAVQVKPTDTAPPTSKPVKLSELTPGKEGEGKEGGRGSGIGEGEGSGIGPGKSSKRALRRDRWTLQIPRREFADRLANLQATLAVPAGNETFHVYRNLGERPAKGTLETQAELGKANLLWWRNDDALVLEALAYDLGLASAPPYVAVFIPLALEDELLRQELAFKGLTENQIAEQKLETSFHAERQGDRWVVKVIEQKPRRSASVGK